MRSHLHLITPPQCVIKRAVGGALVGLLALVGVSSCLSGLSEVTLTSLFVLVLIEEGLYPVSPVHDIVCLSLYPITAGTRSFY